MMDILSSGEIKLSDEEKSKHIEKGKFSYCILSYFLANNKPNFFNELAIKK